MLASAAATPLDIDKATMDAATAACIDGDEVSCLHLVDVNARAWAASVWGQVAGTDTMDPRRWAAQDAYLDAACVAGIATACWVVDRNLDRACLVDPLYCPGGVAPSPPRGKSPCLDEARATCPEVATLTALSRPGPQAFPLAEGWAGFGNGRLYPRDVRPGLLVDGADRAAPLGGRGFVFAGAWIDRDPAKPTTVSFLTAGGWDDVPIDLDDESICGISTTDDEAALVRLSRDGRCFGRNSRWVYPDGRVEDGPEAFVDAAGPWTLRFVPETRGYVRQRRGGAPEVVPFETTVQDAHISPEGHVAGYASGWRIWNGDTIAVAPVTHAMSPRADWGGGHLVVALSDFVVKIAVDGTIAGVWALPEAVEHFRVHPDGRSFWGRSYYGVEAMYGFDGPIPNGRIPDWVADARAHRLAWTVHPEPGAAALTVTLDGAPVEGAFAMGQYTGSDGRVVATRTWNGAGLPCAARLDGICRYGTITSETGSIEIAPVVMGHFPDGHPRDVRGTSGPVVVGLDLGDGEVGLVAKGGEGTFVTEGTGEANPATSVHRSHIPTIEPMYEGVISGGVVRWTPHPFEWVQVVDEAGLPLAGAAASNGWGRGTTGLDGRAELRDGSSAPLKSSRGVADARGPNDGVAHFMRPLPERPLPERRIAAGGAVGSLTELYGLWRDVFPTDEVSPVVPHVWAYTPFQAPPIDLAGRTALVHDDRTLVVLDADHLVGGQAWHRSKPVPRAFERVVAPKKAKNNDRWFTGVFGWRAGDRVERTTTRNGSSSIDVGMVSALDAGVAIDWTLSTLGRFLPMRPRRLELHREGWFIGVGPDELGVLEQQLYDVGAGRSAYGMSQDHDLQKDWPFRASRDWQALVQVLVGRRLERDVTVVELHLDHDDEPTRIALTYRGQETCTIGRCARIELRLGENERTRYIDLLIEPDTLRPVRRRVVYRTSTEVETWVWSR